jgi:hypothetical protein
MAGRTTPDLVRSEGDYVVLTVTPKQAHVVAHSISLGSRGGHDEWPGWVALRLSQTAARMQAVASISRSAFLRGRWGLSAASPAEEVEVDVGADGIAAAKEIALATEAVARAVAVAVAAAQATTTAQAAARATAAYANGVALPASRLARTSEDVGGVEELATVTTEPRTVPV